jgi:uncharacterized caspase-like protein
MNGQKRPAPKTFCSPLGKMNALAAMERKMGAGTGGDLAVVMFSGHGTMIDDQFYLVPYGVDDSTPARLKSSAIPATEFQSEISKLVTHGRVLELLDACRSAGLIGKAVLGADRLRSALASSNVTVLTSSTADKVSREDEKWQHGAFTKVLLDALGSADDIDTDRKVRRRAPLTRSPHQCAAESIVSLL